MRHKRKGRLPVLGLVVAVVVLVPTVVFAKSSYLSAWSTKYPASSSDTNAGCQLCHGTVTGNYNAYGWAVRQRYLVNGGDIDEAIAFVEGVNSDADPAKASNLGEATANTQPGWTYGSKNKVYDSAGAVTLMAPPGAITGNLDPVTEVKVGDNVYTPATVAPKMGTRVHWSRDTGSTGSHNVREVGGIFTSGAPTTGAINYTVTFSAGTFKYACTTHPTQTGTVKVAPVLSAAPTGLPFTVSWATSLTTSGTKWDVEYRIGAGAWTPWKANTTALKGVFGQSGVPVTVVSGTTYSFRVESKSATASSGYSPIKSFTA